MLSQSNIMSNVTATASVFGDTPDDVRLNFLPLSHIFARTCDLYIWMARGVVLALAESRESIVEDCHAVQPTMMNGVPYFFDRVMRTLKEKGVADQPGMLRTALGGRMRLCCSGGAALPDATYDYYHSQDVVLLQGYGLTETSPVITVNAPGGSKRGAAGRAIEHVEIQIGDDGEILTRGPHVMQGYWRRPEATAEVMRDGWFATGDLGRIDDEGYLFITGRKKEILVTAGGKNVAPVLLESLLGHDPLILQAMVVGDDQKYLGALLVPDLEALQRRAAEAGLAEQSTDQLLSDAQVRQWYESAVHDRLASLSHYEQIQRFCFVESPFSIEKGELTPKLSLRRPVIAEHYAEQIRSLYM